MVTNFDSNEIITAQNYNDLIADINQIYGTGNGDSGYGGKSTNVVSGAVNLPSITAGDTVENEQWLDLRNAFADCASHQGTVLSSPLPLLANLEDGDEVGFGPNAAPLFASLNGPPPNNVTELTTNRLNSDIANFETSTKLSSIRTTTWNTSLTHEFTTSFNDSDHARFFFNTGGELRLSASRTGGSTTAQNQSWTDLLNGANPFIFSGTNYFALTTSFVTLATVYASSSTTYGNPAAPDNEKNRMIIQARRDDAAGINGGNGSVIRIKIDFIDGFLGPTQDALGDPGVPVGGLPDNVDGTFTSSVSQKRSILFFDIQTALFSNITQL